jgi:glycosyltransferase involved in cell wall biosynthesis
MIEARRVALFLIALAGGGAERVVLNLVRGFVEHGRAVDLVVCRAEGELRGSVPPGVALVELKALRSWAAMLGLARYLRRRRPACLFSAMDTANLIALAARRLSGTPTRIVGAIHNTPSHQLAASASLKERLQLPLARRLYPRADALVAVSAGVAADAAAMLGLEPHRIAVIANPVVTPELVERAAAPLDDPWLRPGEPPVVLACGRLAPQKDFPCLLHAFALLRARRPARLLILGEGAERPALEALARRLGVAAEARLPGFVANPLAYMRRAAVLALSSRHEGSPVVLVEALACGCPVVATDCPSGPREILEGVAATRLVPVGDPAALARGLDELIAAGARPQARLDRFDYRRTAGAYLALGHA